MTAIPTGRRRVTMRYSPGFRRWLPLLSDVPGYGYVPIHPGNRIHNPRGCPMPGRSYSITKGGQCLVIDGARWANPYISEIVDALVCGEEAWCEGLPRQVKF